MLPLIAGGIISGVGSLISGGMQAGAADRAAQTQARASRYATDEQRRQYDVTRQDMQPYMQAGEGAIGRLGGMVTDPNSSMMRGFGVTPEQQFGRASRGYGFDPYDKYGAIATRQSGLPSIQDAYGAASREFQFNPEDDPSYQFRLQEGLGAIEGSQVAKGKFFSGETGKALMGYGQDFASQEYGKAFDRDLRQRQFAADQYGRLSGLDLEQRGFESGQYGKAMSTDLAQRGFENEAYNRAFGQDITGRQTEYDMLSGVAALGQSSAAQMGTMGTQVAGNIGDYGMQGARARGQGGRDSAAAWGGAIQNISNQMMSGLGTYTNRRMMENAGLNNGGMWV